jgi:hypothetical protein
VIEHGDSFGLKKLLGVAQAIAMLSPAVLVYNPLAHEASMNNMRRIRVWVPDNIANLSDSQPRIPRNPVDR